MNKKTSMRLFYVILLLGVISCNTFIKKNQMSEMNIDSMAYKQIENTTEFWEFARFILKYPESEFFYPALQRYHLVRNAYYDSVGMPIIDCFRNCASIQIKANQKIVFEGEQIELKDLHDSLLVFFCNADYCEFKPEIKYVDDVYGNPQEISKGNIQLEYINDSFTVLQTVVKEIRNSIRSYKNYLAQKWYKKKLEELVLEEEKHLDSLFYYRLMLFGWDEEYIVPPLPPPPIVNESSITLK
ncbi:hypothetical protein DMA11_06815 [Marinilabiliaceae bacterium JC017]|nr:hypothetical protein DMA11_06815 [Marinilabiliaceae bacterium JC017]